VGPDARRRALLRRLGVWLDGRLAVISGRRIADIDRILSGEILTVAGVHGLERRTAEARVDAEPHPAVGRAQDALLALAAAEPGLKVEMKALAVALHYRARPDLGERLTPIVADLCAATGLILQRGDKVLELRTPGPDKGDAVRAFMADPPFAGARPVYVGDDLTDESAFAAAQALGGFGVLVGDARPTAARYRLAGVEAVLDWLDALRPAGAPGQRLAAAHV
jgi:trehalose 6-phosphate phosphatase